MDTAARARPAPTLRRSFERHLRARNLSEQTVEGCKGTIDQVEQFLAARGLGLADATRADLEAYLADLLQRRSPATAAYRHKHLKVLYRWLDEEEEIDRNPMARIKAPIVPEQPVPCSARTASAACSPAAAARASTTAATWP